MAQDSRFFRGGPALRDHERGSGVAFFARAEKLMHATLSKADDLKAIQEIPDKNVSIDDVLRRLILLNGIQTGLEQRDAREGLLTQDEVEAEFEARRKARSA